MAAFKTVFWGITCFIFSSHLFAQPGNGSIEKRRELIKLAWSQVGIKEETGKNDGLQIETFLAWVGLKKGYSWCAAVVSYDLSKSGIANPRSALAADYFKSYHKIVYTKQSGIAIQAIHAGDTFGLWLDGGIHHVGFVLIWGGTWVETLEGNTNEHGSNNGDGFYHKKRLRNQIYIVSTWL